MSEQTPAAPAVLAPFAPAPFIIKQDCEGLHLYGYEYPQATEANPKPDIVGVTIPGLARERHDTLFGLIEALPRALAWLKEDACRSVSVVITDREGHETVCVLLENPNACHPETSSALPYVYAVAVALPVQEGGAA